MTTKWSNLQRRHRYSACIFRSETASRAATRLTFWDLTHCNLRLEYLHVLAEAAAEQSDARVTTPPGLNVTALSLTSVYYHTISPQSHRPLETVWDEGLQSS